MRLIIVDASHSEDPQDLTSSRAAVYRGADRSKLPAFQWDELSSGHPLNQALAWYLEAGQENLQEYGVIHDLEKARDLVKLFNEYAETAFEIVELTVNQEHPAVGTEFLGFDLLAEGFGDSLLRNGLKVKSPKNGKLSTHRHLDAFLRRIYPLDRLIERYFKPKLNDHLLFKGYKVARFCLDCQAAIATSTPNMKRDWEEAGYRIVGIYRVPLQ